MGMEMERKRSMDCSSAFAFASASAAVAAVRWWSQGTVVVVTGANRGIGYALVKRLAELGLTVVLTARDAGKGMAAVESLRAEGLLRVQFSQLDVADASSITAFASWLRQTLGALDILVNNAGVSFNVIDRNSVEHAEEVIRTNFYGPKRLTEALLPLFRRSAHSSRILNMSSQLGLLSKLNNAELRRFLQDEEELSGEKIEQMVMGFLKQVKEGTWEEGGWPKAWTDYSVSKLALNAYSRLLSVQQQQHGLCVNCFCPGFTRTAMTQGRGSWSPERAAGVTAKLVLLPLQDLPTGMFFKRLDAPSLYSKM